MHVNLRHIDAKLAIYGKGKKKKGKRGNHLIHLPAMWLNSKALNSGLFCPVLALWNSGQNCNITGIMLC